MHAERSSSNTGQVFFGLLPEGRIRLLDLRHVRRRRYIRLGMLGGACAALLLLVGLGLPGSSWQAGVAVELASSQLTSRQLQERLASLPGRHDDFRASSDLRVIDAELQAAYDRNATDVELKALWKLRNEVLRSLAADGHPVQSLTRI